MTGNFIEGHSIDKVQRCDEPSGGRFFSKDPFDQASAIDPFNDVIVEVGDTEECLIQGMFRFAFFGAEFVEASRGCNRIEQ